MQKLLQINSDANSCSTGRIAEQIGQFAISNGWESYIAYGRDKNSSKSHLIRIGNAWDLIFHGVQTRLFDRHGIGSKRATKNLIKQIKKIEPTIIHLHNLHGYYLNIEILFNYLSCAGIPVVWTLHDCWSFTGHCTYFDSIACSKWRTQCYKCPQINEYPASFFVDRSEKNFQLKKKLFNSIPTLKLVSVSNWLEHVLKKSFMSDIPSVIIHNGIDTSLFKPIEERTIKDRYELNNSFILLGVASIWSARKGLNEFIELSKNVDCNTKIILIGLNKKQIKALPTNIIGLQRTESISELAEFYSVADLVLNLSSEESFGLTTVEGFACGTPGIVYNCTASPELITPETGLIVEKGNLVQLVAAIEQIKIKGKAFYSENCLERAQKFYNNQKQFNEYILLYEKLLCKQI
ncbi:glycosyl transferase group 1 [Paludibacter propionicigenes WB4]|uniref:Glycosyl transferase group 1 n=1 Tax=Paludibacter propionicigenes (strain DSM 17365 / JCM 13257 / WB4) TaxID=694427 RepID=E4T316_PALPW|nr:glycosyltransferase [Paludibacter propionicigenes]ADQ79110.1 glycosyl transferase group 1 [Paludibacter propionicigenes WB4]